MDNTVTANAKLPSGEQSCFTWLAHEQFHVEPIMLPGFQDGGVVTFKAHREPSCAAVTEQEILATVAQTSAGCSSKTQAQHTC